MDFLKVSDKTTTPYRNNSLFGLSQQHMEIHPHPHPHPHVITPRNNLSSMFSSFDLILKT